ncbi:hypothetical protein MKK55_18710 [Methylobacterium sp. J-059]|uniref:hypothetical protein n=1 Tax=Methylobacterium sp. J-059 TaxID=2836643 RepID=UPI001FB9AD48|nr:hypothetical protein [Methylobacterium sp. J-059]MCJ2040963.1 hypothetical protein [Methylobacterium sp. J-059]
MTEHTFHTLGNLPLRLDNPDDGYSIEDLRGHGWAPGGYLGHCQDCVEVFVGDKRCRRCRPCAIKSLEAYRNRPTWQSGHRGIPPDRPVWAYFYESGSGEDEDVMLLHGISDEGGEVFTVQHERVRDWDRYGKIVCWIDVEECPALSVEAVDAIVAALADQRGIYWGCADHIVEDWLHRAALQAVVDGHRDAAGIAAAALKSRELKFSRYYG